MYHPDNWKKAFACRWIGEPVTCTSLSTDTRSLLPGALFIALPGQHQDGHRFIQEAIHRGAAAVMVSQEQQSCSVPQCLVEDTYEAVLSIIRYVRSQITGPVIAVTGSVGKTTTKYMIDALLKQQYTVLSTDRNWNTEYGLAQLCFQYQPYHQACVVELGAAKPGDIAFLSELIRPTHGLVTCIQKVHLSRYPSFDALIETKLALLSYLEAHQGKVVIPTDDPLLTPWQERFPAERRMTYGPGGNWQAQEVNLIEGKVQALLSNPQNHTFPLALRMYGVYQVRNALAALAMGSLCGLDTERMLHTLSELTGVPQRLQAEWLSPDILLFDDTYNAGQQSVEGAIATLASYKNTHHTVLSLGSLAELSPQEAVSTHVALGRYAAQQGIHQVIGWGGLTVHTAQAHPQGVFCETLEAVLQQVQAVLSKPVVIVVKGSRSAAMERVVVALRQQVQGSVMHV